LHFDPLSIQYVFQMSASGQTQTWREKPTNALKRESYTVIKHKEKVKGGK
jgi:hypothetical protein